MKKIAMSLATIAAVLTLAISATSAYFSSTANVNNVTFASGTLQIRVNGQPSITGATFSPMAPDQMGTSQFDINNYGAPWFSGPSNLTARQLLLSVSNASGDSGLWNSLYVKIEVNRGWPTWQQAYWGPLNGLANVDLLHPNWSELAPGNSETFRYTVWLPNTNSNQNALMGKSVSWNWAIEGRTN